MTLLAEKRKVGSSTMPLTTISQPGRLPASPAFGLFKGCFVSIWNADLWDFCGGTPEAVGGSRSRLSSDFGLRVRGPARVAGNGQRADWLAITG